MFLRLKRFKFQRNIQILGRLNNPKSVLYGLVFLIMLVASIGMGINPALSAPKKDKPMFPRISLLENARGERAIQVLADKLPQVAAWYGSTPQEFAKMLREDHTTRIDMDGHLFFAEEIPDQAGEEEIPPVAEASYPYDQTFKLHSLPGSKKVIFIDFDGHTTTGTAWNTSYANGSPINSPAYDLDGDTSSFSNTEMDRIQDIWKLVSENYAPFDVDVTTEDPGQDAINAQQFHGDDSYGTRVVITSR